MKKILLLIFTLFIYLPVFADDVSDGEILYICSYNADTFYSNEFTADFTSEYAKLGGKCNLVIEMMNCSNLDTHGQWMDSMNDILSRHENPKLIILYGPEAWICYLSLQEEKWRQTPICLIASQRYAACVDFDDIPAIKRTNSNRKTVVDVMELIKPFNVKMFYYYEYGVKEAMLALQSLYPNLHTVAVVGDNSYSGYSMLKYSVEEIKNNFPKLSIKEIDGSRDNTKSAMKALSSLKYNSAILYAIWRYDRDGILSLSNDYKLFESLKDIPVLTLTGRGLGNWALGGCMPMYDWHDVRILHPSLLAYEMVDRGIDIEPYRYRFPNYYQFDMNVVEKLGLDENKLPEGSALVNNRMTFSAFYTQHKIHFIVIIFSFIILLVALILMIVYSLRMKQMKDILQKSEHQLVIDKEQLHESEQNLKLAKERAEASDKMKTHFIHNILHEIRTPLNAIQGFSEILLDPNNALDEESKRNMSFRIGQNVDTITDIISNMLEYSDIESKDYAIVKKSVMCKSVCEAALKVAKHYKREEVELRFNTNIDDNFSFNTDARLVREVLIQLLKNSAKFTEKGFIELDCKELCDDVVFTITDTGPGVPLDKVEFVFERFKKLDDFSQGIGLGLSLSRSIARKLGGDVTYDTSFKGGSRFVFVHPKK